MKKNNSRAATLGGKMKSNFFKSECSSAHGANKKTGCKAKESLRLK